MLISDYLKRDCIAVNMASDSKEEVIRELAELQFKVHPELNREETMKGLFEREDLLTTGIGKGIAIPHARVGSCSEICVSFGLLSEGLDFNSLDEQPVRIVLLILFPKDQVNLQLRFLARVSRLLQHASLHDDLYRCETAEDVVRVFKEFEEKHFH